ncbi:uncharacterized protein KY384_007451 [Bacidia gigantensis]|uniref:uncharacterized protein n=1 Tax=Bacidia gigantensis TaxID=2732470 RepID=UPI001D047B0F|nr:uncharacterized protein KY384_007451 [Bacidia gigantensis]KAG8528533.1 hypothetical protein KY384_007451 [Bacidia gigantensis]
MDQEVVRAVQNLQRPLEDCSSTYDDLVQRLKGYLKPVKGKADQYAVSSSSRFMWYLFRKELNEMLANVERSKSSLHTAMNAVTMICVVNAAPDTLAQRIHKPPDADRDVGIALRYYAESVHHARTIQESLTIVEPTNSVRRTQTAEVEPTQSSIQTPYDISNEKSEQLQRAGNQQRGLHQAASEDDYIQIEILIGEGADINARDASGRTALHLAAEQGNVASVHILQRHGIKLNTKTYSKGNDGERQFWGQATALYLACSNGHSEIVQILLDAGASVDAANYSNRTPLMQAAKYGHKACAEKLLDHGANPYIREINGFIPLHDASGEGKIGCLATQQLILDRGCDINARTGKLLHDSTPLHLAARELHMECVRDLVNRGADVEAKNHWEVTALHEAAFYNAASDVLRILVNDGDANIEARDHRLETPLHKAVHGSKADNVRFLLLKGANAYAKDEASVDAIEVAILKHHQGVLHEMKKHLPNDQRLNPGAHSQHTESQAEKEVKD